VLEAIAALRGVSLDEPAARLADDDGQPATAENAHRG
jgi:hypothetical protein